MNQRDEIERQALKNYIEIRFAVELDRLMDRGYTKADAAMAAENLVSGILLGMGEDALFFAQEDETGRITAFVKLSDDTGGLPLDAFFYDETSDKGQIIH